MRVKIRAHRTKILLGLVALLIVTSLSVIAIEADPATEIEGGHWAEPAQPNPKGWDCLLWVNNDDSDIATLWCETEKPKKEKRGDDV